MGLVTCRVGFDPSSLLLLYKQLVYGNCKRLSLAEMTFCAYLLVVVSYPFLLSLVGVFAFIIHTWSLFDIYVLAITIIISSTCTSLCSIYNYVSYFFVGGLLPCCLGFVVLSNSYGTPDL